MNNLKYINFEEKLLPFKMQVRSNIVSLMKRYTNGELEWNEKHPFYNKNGVMYSIVSAKLEPNDQVIVKLEKYSKLKDDNSSEQFSYRYILSEDISIMIKFYNNLYDKIATMLLDRNMGKVFLGGSCGDTTWRTDLIFYLEQNEIEYFNPVVEDWNDETFKKEQEEKLYAATLLFVLSPRTANVYSIAEMVNLIRDERRVIVVFLENDGDKSIDPFSKVAFSNIQKDMTKFKNAIFASFKSFNHEAIEFIINQINQ
jgi:hypothetical protein